MNKVGKKILIVLSVFVIAALSIMIIANAWYSVYFYDDFIHAARIGVFQVGFFEYLKATFAFTKMMYMGWQGTYFSMFLQALLSPLNGGGLIQLRMVMVVNAVIFLASLAFFINTLVSCLNKEVSLEIRLSVIALVFIQLFSTLDYPEIFSWFSGAVCYSYPLTFLFISISLTLISERNKKIVYLILAIISGFLGMGGVLAITGMGCAFMLVLVLIPLLFEKKLKRNTTIVFASYFVFALIGALAPGNFLRRGYVEGSISPVKTLFLSAKKYLYGVESVFKDTKIAVLLLLFIIFGLVLGKMIAEKELKKYIVASILMLAVPFVTLFPIVLGYGGYSYFPNRCTFLLNLTVTPIILNFALIVGILLHKYLGKEDNIRISIGLLSILALILFLVNGNRMEDNLAVVQMNNLANGRVKTFYNECNNMLSEIENSTEEDVVLERNPYAVEHFAEFYLSDDPEFVYNVKLAEYYGKKSIRVKNMY